MTNIPTPPAYPSGRNLLAGKTVLVTAAAGTGIGFATAKRAVEEGARVVVSDIHQRRLQEALDQLGPNAHAVMGNVTAEDDVQRMIDEAVEFGGGQLDVLVNNAGLGGTAVLTEMTDEQWFAVLDVTLTGTMRMTRAALRHMCGQAGGAIVNNASVVGWRAQELLAELETREAFGRAAEPWEVANVIVFLASDLASYMTGEIVSVSSQHP
jgi:3-oxoacyl-[acyl-carrier protein] reductase